MFWKNGSDRRELGFKKTENNNKFSDLRKLDKEGMKEKSIRRERERARRNDDIRDRERWGKTWERAQLTTGM